MVKKTSSKKPGIYDFTTKRELVLHLKAKLSAPDFVLFCTACVDEDIYEALTAMDSGSSTNEEGNLIHLAGRPTESASAAEIVEYAHHYWKLPNIGTMHVYSVQVDEALTS